MQFTILLRSAKPRAVLLLGASLCCWPLQAAAAATAGAANPAPPQLSTAPVVPVATLQDAEDAAKPPVKKPAPTPQRRARTAAKPALKPAPAPDPAGVAALTGAPNAAAPAGATGTSWDIVMADKTLNGAMARWAAAAGWQLSWELPVDYAVQARTSVAGSFDEAVTQVVNSMESAEIPMQAIFYKGNKVLRILAKGAR